MRKFAVVAAASAMAFLVSRPGTPAAAAASHQDTPGALVSAQGDCPLKHTDVKGEISGFLSRVTVTQEFTNPFQDKIEAVYSN